MQEKEYYNEINNIIEGLEVNTKVRRVLEENYDTLNNFWEIGRLLVEAQGGKDNNKRGNELIKKWSIEFTKNYGNNYSHRELYKMRQFYLDFPILPTMSAKISWSHIIEVLPIKDINKRNYYLNEVIKNNLSVRKVIKEIKSNS